MPYAPEHKQRSRARILQTAIRLFADRGFDKVSIDEVMAAAGMTRGAFYAHFNSKSALYAESISVAAANSLAARAQGQKGDATARLRRLVGAYLSPDHIDGTNEPCPLGFLATDIVNRDPIARRAYNKAYRGLAAVIADHLGKGRQKDKEERAYAITALLIGGVAIGRAVGDKETTNALLASCLRTVERLITAR